MKITPLQSSFSSGEISPKLLGRTDAAGYQSGLAVMNNFMADSRGPSVRRGGTRFLAEIDGNDGRIFAFVINESLGYLLVLTDLLLTPYTQGGVTTAVNYVLNPRFRDGSTNWVIDDDGGKADIDFSPDLLLMANENKNGASCMVGQEITVPSSGTYKVAVEEVLGEAYTVTVGTSLGDDSYGRFSSNIGGIVNEQVDIPSTTAWVSVINSIKNVTVGFTLISTIGTVAATDFVTPWKESELKDIHIIVSSGGREAYLTHPNHPPQKVVYNYDLDSFLFAEVVFTDPPAQWTGTNWPRTGVFHEGRLWLAGTPEEPQTLWASKSNDYENFTLGPLADESLVFTVAKQGDIRWIQSTKNLLIGTTTGEHIVTSVEGVITPGDIQVTQQSAYGSKGLQAVLVGDQVFYISSDGRKVRAMQYEWAADNWLSNDLTFFSEQITKAGIRHIAWAQNPDNLFMCVLEDGTSALLTYERGEEIYGWSRHDFGGKVLDFAVGNSRGADVKFALVQRVDGTMYIEDFPVLNNIHMDSWMLETLNEKGSAVAGLGHLEGETVQVLADGAVHPEKVVTGGEITLDWPATEVYVGLPFVSTMVTLPFDKGSQGGSGQTHMKRYNKLFVTLLDSSKPLINGERQPERYPSTLMDTREPDRTERSSVAELGWTRDATITVVQDLPLPCTVISFAGELAQEIL